MTAPTAIQNLATVIAAAERGRELLAGAAYEVRLLRQMARDLDGLADAVEQRQARAMGHTSANQEAIYEQRA